MSRPERSAGAGWRALLPSRWRALLPSRWGWLRLLASPSSYLLLIALVLTALSKLRVLSALEGVNLVPLRWLGATAVDAAFYLSLAALFALGERRARWLLWITLPLSLLVFALAAINAIYLGIAGEQLTWQTVAIGLQRFGDAGGIVGETVHHIGGLRIAGVVLAILAPPALALWWLRRRGRSLAPGAEGGARAHAAALVAVLGLLAWLVTPAPRAFALGQLSRNAVLGTYWGWLKGEAQAASTDQVWFQGYQPHDLVAPATIEALRARGVDRPNIIMVVMESTRRDVTQLDRPGAPARTPHLLGLAARGLEVTHGRAIVPHTTKSLFAMLCDRLPMMQLDLYETTDGTGVQCLPRILGEAGWRTAFLQSALGSFEDRPRLVHRLGYQHFAAWEDLGGQPLGYLASDDEHLAIPLGQWIDQGPPGQPFFVTLMTSSTHHPYRLTPAAAARARADRAPADTDFHRYARMVEAEDHLIGEIEDLLRSRGLLDHTIIVALGDHGEGFGDKGIRQHDNNFFDEGLRVPWVIAGPGVPHAQVTVNATVADLTPTILATLGAAPSPEAARTTPGMSLLGAGPPPGRMLVFSCFYDMRCRGFVDGDRKVVFIPEAQRAFWFDLARDPDEREPMPLDQSLAAEMLHAHHVVDSHRTRDWPKTRTQMNAYPPWTCPAGQHCHHPNTPPGGLFGAGG